MQTDAESMQNTWEEKFDDNFTKRYGAENLDLFLVPHINENAKCWVVENVTNDIKVFISQLLEETIAQERKNYVGRAYHKDDRKMLGLLVEQEVLKAVAEARQSLKKELLEKLPKECKDADNVRVIIDNSDNYEKFGHLKNQKMGIAMGYNQALSEVKHILEDII